MDQVQQLELVRVQPRSRAAEGREKAARCPQQTSHRATLLSHNPSTVADEDECSSKCTRTASEAGVGAAMEAAISSGDEADPEPWMLPESQGACPSYEFGDIAVLLGEPPNDGQVLK